MLFNYNSKAVLYQHYSGCTLRFNFGSLRVEIKSIKMRKFFRPQRMPVNRYWSLENAAMYNIGRESIILSDSFVQCTTQLNLLGAVIEVSIIALSVDKQARKEEL
mmetsp:Transcript_24650/g.30999  ORF Transcript_24650/g.30999 Transcript_24650/m.30999 type:complete len:105 (+) Transcript_24650:354-668(+)